jgi:hypothetical protein
LKIDQHNISKNGYIILAGEKVFDTQNNLTIEIPEGDDPDDHQTDIIVMLKEVSYLPNFVNRRRRIFKFSTSMYTKIICFSVKEEQLFVLLCKVAEAKLS